MRRDPIPAVNCSITAIFSRISSKRRAGSLEGTHCFCLDHALDAGFEGSLLNQIHPLSEEFGKPKFQTDHRQQRDAASFIESGQQVNIGIRALVAPGDGSKYREPQDAGSPKLRFTGAEDGY